MSAIAEEIGRFAHFTWLALIASVQAFAQPRELARQFARQLLGALPLAIVCGLTIGIVVWMHLRGVLVRFGGPSAADVLPSALAIAVLLEFGPIGAGLICAGRTGAALGAELGAMRISEQADALELLGKSPLRYLAGPRILACVLVLPVLTVVIDCLAILGSFFAEWTATGTTWLHYKMSCLRGLRLDDVIPATLKTMVFGFVIGVAGCYFGLRADGGTEGVGRAATRSVVMAIFAVLVADAVLVRLIQLLNAR